MTRIKLVVPIGVVLDFNTISIFEFSMEVFPGGGYAMIWSTLWPWTSVSRNRRPWNL